MICAAFCSLPANSKPRTEGPPASVIFRSSTTSATLNATIAIPVRISSCLRPSGIERPTLDSVSPDEHSVDPYILLGQPRRPPRAGGLPRPRRLHRLLRLHPHEHADHPQRKHLLVDGKRRKRVRGPPPP